MNIQNQALKHVEAEKAELTKEEKGVNEFEDNVKDKAEQLKQEKVDLRHTFEWEMTLPE